MNLLNIIQINADILRQSVKYLFVEHRNLLISERNRNREYLHIQFGYKNRDFDMGVRYFYQPITGYPCPSFHFRALF
jgi:hypothetical protein